jgi:hypothetical protein
MMKNDYKTPRQRARAIVQKYAAICWRRWFKITLGNEYLEDMITEEIEGHERKQRNSD